MLIFVMFSLCFQAKCMFLNGLFERSLITWHMAKRMKSNDSEVSAISVKFRNPERLTASENMKPFISSYTIQSHIFLINIKLSNKSKSSIKSRDDKLRSKRRSNQLWTQSRTRSRIASLCQICQSWSRCWMHHSV